jgi:hypothetical protein
MTILHSVAYLETVIYQLLSLETEREQVNQLTDDIKHVPYCFHEILVLLRNFQHKKYKLEQYKFINAIYVQYLSEIDYYFTTY